MTATISRLYNSYADAKEAVRNLEAAGVPHNDISIIASNADQWYSSDRTGEQGTFPDRDLDGKDDRAEAAGAGAGVGAAAGGTAGLLAGLGLMAIPGVGPVVAAGWLVSTLAGAAAGGVAGSGSLVLIPRNRTPCAASFCDAACRSGASLRHGGHHEPQTLRTTTLPR